MNLGGKGQTSHFSRSPGSSYNTLTDEEYSAGRILSLSNLTLNQTFIHCRNTIYHEFQAVPAPKPSIQHPPSMKHISNPTQSLIYNFNLRHMYATDSNQYLKEKV